MNDFVQTSRTYHAWHPWTDMAAMLEKGTKPSYSRSKKHSLFSDTDEHFDGSAGLWNVNLGHGRTEIIQAISSQLERLTFHSLIDTPSGLANQLSERLLKWAPGNLQHVMYHCNGTSATEGALMLMRQLNIREGHPEKTEIIALEGGFHGSSYLMAAVSGLPSDADYFAPLPIGVHHIPAPFTTEDAGTSLAKLKALIAERGERLQSFIVEPLMGCEGAFEVPKAWLQEVVETCRAASITVIADEIATGLGRTGGWFGWPEGVHVDALAVGKGLSAGYVPIAATLYDADIFDRFIASEGGELRFGSTMDGCPAALAAGNAVLSFLEKHSIPEHVRTIRNAIESRLKELLKLPCVREIRGRGFMIGIQLCAPENPAKDLSTDQMFELVDRIREQGVVLDPEGNSSLLFYPPLTSSLEELCAAISRIEMGLAKYSPIEAEEAGA